MIKIRNETEYNTRDLRKVVNICFDKSDSLNIIVKYRKSPRNATNCLRWHTSKSLVVAVPRVGLSALDFARNISGTRDWTTEFPSIRRKSTIQIGVKND